MVMRRFETREDQAQSFSGSSADLTHSVLSTQLPWAQEPQVSRQASKANIAWAFFARQREGSSATHRQFFSGSPVLNQVVESSQVEERPGSQLKAAARQACQAALPSSPNRAHRFESLLAQAQS